MHARHMRGHPTRGRAGPWEVLVVFGLCLILGGALFHRTWTWPSTTLAGSAGDADEYTWFLAWAPFRYGPWPRPAHQPLRQLPRPASTSCGTRRCSCPAFLMSPVTVCIGAGFSYNVLATMAPVLCTTFAYVAFRRWTGRYRLWGALSCSGFPPTSSRNRWATWPRPSS